MVAQPEPVVNASAFNQNETIVNEITQTLDSGKRKYGDWIVYISRDTQRDGATVTIKNGDQKIQKRIDGGKYYTKGTLNRIAANMIAEQLSSETTKKAPVPEVKTLSPVERKPVTMQTHPEGAESTQTNSEGVFLPGSGSEQTAPEKMSLEEFLGRRGLSSPISDYTLDKTRIPHGETQRQQNQRIAEGERVASDYAARRQEAIQTYNDMVALGQITPKTTVDRLLSTANGHEDNQATISARRALEKRGIDWRTGQPLSETGTDEGHTKITANMSDQQRYDALKDRTINVPSYNAEKLATIEQGGFEALENAGRGNAFNILRKIGEQFGVFKSYRNEDVGVEFAFSKGNLRESVYKKNKEYQNYAKMMTVFDDVIDNAVGLETHENRYDSSDDMVKSTYVLMSAYQSENGVVPVLLEVREFFDDTTSTLRIAVSMTEIERSRIVAYNTTGDSTGSPYTLPASEYKLADLFQNVNTEDGRMLKYIPDGFLDEGQKQAKDAALLEQEEYVRAKNEKRAAKKNGVFLPGSGLEVTVDLDSEGDGIAMAADNKNGSTLNQVLNLPSGQQLTPEAPLDSMLGTSTGTTVAQTPTGVKGQGMQTGAGVFLPGSQVVDAENATATQLATSAMQVDQTAKVTMMPTQTDAASKVTTLPTQETTQSRQSTFLPGSGLEQSGIQNKPTGIGQSVWYLLRATLTRMLSGQCMKAYLQRPMKMAV